MTGSSVAVRQIAVAHPRQYNTVVLGRVTIAKFRASSEDGCREIGLTRSPAPATTLLSFPGTSFKKPSVPFVHGRRGGLSNLDVNDGDEPSSASFCAKESLLSPLHRIKLAYMAASGIFLW